VSRTAMKRTIPAILTGVLSLFAGVALAQVPSDSLSASQCGTLKNAYGPFDYRTSRSQLEVVENFHFGPDVEQLRRGKSTYDLAGDLDYTLRASPNHHRALVSLTNLAVRTGASKLPGNNYPVDCYFERALRFANDDGLVRIIYGVYLYRTGKKKDALRTLEDARRFENDNPNLHYNLGLVYFDLHDIPHALESAQTAYRLGAQLPGLKNKLKAAGVWDPGVIAKPSDDHDKTN
jgi:tetratricopeptide (TPR) repeat protein